MKVFTSIQALLTTLFFTLEILPLLSSATPAPGPGRARVSSPYYLRVDVQHASGNVGRHSHFNGRYVQIYHTGAGTNDIALAVNRSETRPAFLNGTHQQFNLSTQSSQEIPWGLYMPTLVQYTQWQAPAINVGYGYDYGAFFLDRRDGNALIWNTADEPGRPAANATTAMNGFGGWLACDWWHGVPQLFWQERYYLDRFVLPANCEVIKLRAEFV